MAKDGPRPHLTPDDPAERLLAAALASGASYTRAAEQAGVSKSTCKRRMADPAFRHQVEQLRHDHVARVEQRLGQLAGQALDTLEALLADTDAPAQRLGAARTLLEGMLKFREQGAVEQRLADLEVRVGDRHPLPIGPLSAA